LIVYKLSRIPEWIAFHAITIADWPVEVRAHQPIDKDRRMDGYVLGQSSCIALATPRVDMREGDLLPKPLLRDIPVMVTGFLTAKRNLFVLVQSYAL